MFNKILNQLKKLMETAPKNNYLGAKLSKFDPRNIKFSEVVKIPVTAVVQEDYQSDISFLKRNNQKNHGSCVAQAHVKTIEALQYLDIGQTEPLSARYHYALCKQKDGNTDQGTYPSVSADILKKVGVTTASDVPDDNDLSYSSYLGIVPTKDTLKISGGNKIAGYAYINHMSIPELLFAIKNQKYVPATIAFGDWGWFSGQAKPDKTLKQGLHRVVFYGYKWEKGKLIIQFINSWGTNWGDNGCGWFYYDDYVTAKGESFIYEVMTFVDIPQKVLDKKDTKLETYLKEDKNFLKAIPLILESEGGYVNDPNDKGGETKYGISKRAYPNEDIKNLTLEKAKMIYRRDYWDIMRCGEMPYDIALMVFDMGVNMGTDYAIKNLQNALKVAVDGKVGKITLGAVNKANTGDLLRIMAISRLIAYSKMQNYSIYANSWINRTLKCLILK